MAKMTAADARTFLKEVGLTDEQLSGVTDANLKKVAEGLMRQADYDREMNAGKAEIEAAQAKLEAANQRLSAEMAEWARVEAEGGQHTAKMVKAKEAAEATALKLTQALQRLAAEHGFDATKVLEGAPPPANTPPQNVPDLNGYVKIDQFSQQIDNLANLAVTLPAELHALSVEHQSLFGKPLDARAIVNELRSRAGTRGNQKSLDVRQIWEEQNKVPEARTAAEKKTFDEAIAAAERRGREAAISESSIPGSVNAPGKHAPVFMGERKSAMNRPQPGGTVNAALAALRTGKYRVQNTGAPPRS